MLAMPGHKCPISAGISPNLVKVGLNSATSPSSAKSRTRPSCCISHPIWPRMRAEMCTCSATSQTRSARKAVGHGQMLDQRLHLLDKSDFQVKHTRILQPVWGPTRIQCLAHICNGWHESCRPRAILGLGNTAMPRLHARKPQCGFRFLGNGKAEVLPKAEDRQRYPKAGVGVRRERHLSLARVEALPALPNSRSAHSD